jgi:phage tail sheath protein FI
MPEYLSPGVYVEEVATGPRPIEGVSTSTAGMAGPTERGPVMPRLVTSWPDYQRWFGGYINDFFLPYAVQGFFENGGQRVFVARVVGPNAGTATLSLPTTGAPLVLTAIGPGRWGNNILVRVRTGSQADTNAIPPRDYFRLTLLYYADGIPVPFVDPTNRANLADTRRREPDVIEDYDNLSVDPNSPNSVVATLNARSRLVSIQAGPVLRPTNVEFPDVNSAPARPLTIASVDLATSPAANNTVLRLQAVGPGAWPNAIPITVSAGTAAGFRIQVGGEDYDNQTLATILGSINGASQIVRASWVSTAPPAPPVPSIPDNGAFAFTPGQGNGSSGGTDVAPPTVASFVGNDQVPVDERTGLAGLEAIDEITLLVVPDEVGDNTRTITNEVINQCERLKDRFAIVSALRNQDNVATIRPPRDTTYAAFYYPWIRIFDAEIQDAVLVPSTGHVAGIYARTDSERGVHKAPANEVVRGVITRDLSNNRKPLEFTISKGEHDVLNPRGVNVIRDFRPDRRGIRVWGARTMSSDAMWKYVNVRRLFIFVEESIDEGTQWVVFEPNDETTWSAVRRSVTNFLISVWRSGGLMGTTEEEAFFVKCDRTTMTQDDIDNGRLVCLIGIAPVKPAEFVIFRISQKTADAEA